MVTTRREEELEAKVAELQKQVDELTRTAGRPGAGYYRMAWREYKSARTWMGLPLVHVCYGIDPETGRRGVAKGVFAMGDFAIGIVALGGLSLGVIALGGLRLGVISLAGLSIGLGLALGGCAIGGIALGGCAVGGLAVGGAAIGYIAVGGGAVGVYAVGGDAQSMRPFEQVFSDPAIPAFIKQFIRATMALFKG